jgi:sulfate adenylyltransferase
MINYSDPQTRYLIDYANLKHGLIKHQSDFLDDIKFQSFLKDKFLGCPLVLPLGIKFFDYSKSIHKFRINKKDVKKYIFECKSNDYVGLKIFFKYGNIFCTGATLKKKYYKELNSIILFNEKLKSSVYRYNKNFKTSAFQTRNIPHLGHELILQRLINKKKLLFVNPLIGLKKRGDINNVVLKKVFNYLKNLNLYKSKMIYAPVISNMNYAGPREALHHTYLRELLGFNEFSIGRDHAGAQNNYPPLKAKQFVNANKKRFKVSVFYHNGAYFCNKCNKIILKGDCRHSNLTGISGTEFRKKLCKKKLFIHARNSLQSYINKLDINLFN